MATGGVVVIGGTKGIGLELSRHYARQGREVTIAGRSLESAAPVAEELGENCRAIALDLAEPEGLGGALEGLGDVQHLVLAAIERDENSARTYDVARARRLVILKLVGYTEAIHQMLPRMGQESSILLFGGLAKDRPYPGSTSVSSVNGGVTGMVNTLASELAPMRVNALHPGIVGDSPAWNGKPPEVLEAVAERTPLGRLVTMEEVVGAAVFLLENSGVNGVNLAVDGGWLLR